MKEKLKQKKGITLIALVVTIVVLIILASVSISILLGENGIITKAKIAKEETRGGAVLEARDLWRANQETDKQTNTHTAQTLDELLANLKKQNQLTDEEIAIIKETGSITIGSKTIEFEKGAKTLVAMFEKAQKDGCTNEDRTCNNPEHLHIGDYVDYKNPTSGSYTVPGEKSGMDYEQTYNVAENQSLMWRVLGIDETTGGIKLIAESPVYETVASGATTGNTPNFDIKGAEAYVYAPDEMDKIGGLYKNEYAEIARSVNMDDINQALGIKTEEQIKSKNILPMTTNAIQYGEKYGPFEGHYTPENWLKPDKPTTVVKGTVNGYAFIIGSEGLPPEVSSVAINIENKRLKSMLFDNIDPQTGKPYWLASRGVDGYSGNSYARFGPGLVCRVEGMSLVGFGSYTFDSDGSEYDYAGFVAVRPVVSLKSNITRGNYYVSSRIGEVYLLEDKEKKTDFEEAYIIYEGERINVETCISNYNGEYKYVNEWYVARLLAEKGKIAKYYEALGTIQTFELIKNGESYFADLKIDWEE